MGQQINIENIPSAKKTVGGEDRKNMDADLKDLAQDVGSSVLSFRFNGDPGELFKAFRGATAMVQRIGNDFDLRGEKIPENLIKKMEQVVDLMMEIVREVSPDGWAGYIQARYNDPQQLS
ncbi:MAG: hypothetical protein NZO16_00190 [Deltaproteobacteria bacterium]|nr:hypothetical protein [Deltaproteobacteria bacterium]